MRKPCGRDLLLRLFPPRVAVPPALRVIERTKTDYGVRETVSYAVARSERVRAYLLVPRGRGRRPAILASHQHAGQYAFGKSEPAGLAGDAAQHTGVELCRRGFVVLCPDHLGFEERRPRRVARFEGTASGEREQESLLLADQLLLGSSLAAKYLFDLQQAIDVLATDRRVDAERMGAIGHSLGGQTVLWLAFHDARVRAAFSSCGFSTLAAVQARRIPHNFASYVPGLLRVGDLDDVVAGIAPRAFGMSHASDDPIFPMEGVRRVHRRARAAFPRGRSLRIVFRGGHAFPAPVRLRAYDFLARHLDA